MSNEYKDWLNDFTEEQRTNMELCSKYPILIPKSLYTFEELKDYAFEFTKLDSIPEGWRKAFGEEWAKEIQECIDKLPEKDRKLVEIIELKEKYGSFRQYFTKYAPGMYDIIKKYESLSLHTCIKCGKPATRMSLCWISPYCDDCSKTIEYSETFYPIEDYFKGIEEVNSDND